MRTFRKTAIVTCALIGLCTAGSHAECIVEEQLLKTKLDAIARAGELAKQQKPLLEEQEKILTTKAKDPTRPVGDQLSAQDLGRFSELEQRLKAIQLQQLLESNYSRDYEVIGLLFELIQKLYVGGKEPNQSDPDSKPYEIILGMRYAAKSDDFKGIDDISVPPRSDFEQCNLIAALHLVEHQSITKLNQLPITEASQTFQALAKRSPTGKIDRNQLTPQDRAVYDGIIRNVMAPARREQSFQGDLENLKNIAKAADLKFQAGKKDAVDSGGDINAVGQTIDKMNLDTRMRFGLGILRVVAETFPSEWVRQQEQIQKMMKPSKR